jgi:tetratricopeptide (TPR) repeat protein
VARYSHYVRGYVVTHNELERANGPRGDTLILRDPLSGTKVRCREQLVTWLGAQTRGADGVVRDGHDLMVSMGVMMPFTIAAGAGLILITMPFGAVSWTPHWIAGPPTEATHYRRGIEAFRAGRYDEAARDLETSLAMFPSGGALGGHTYVLYYLGLAYEQLHRDDVARETLRAFVERAGVANDKAYETAEERLARLGVEPSNCASIAPVPFVVGARASAPTGH